MKTNRDRQSWTYRPRRGVRHDYAYRAPEPERRHNRKRKRKPATAGEALFAIFIGGPALAALIMMIIGAMNQ